MGAVGSIPRAVAARSPAGRISAGDQPGRGIEALATHLLGEAHHTQERELDGRTRHERATTTGPLQASLPDEVGERSPDGDEAAAVLVGEAPLGGQPVAGLPLPIIEGTTEVQVHLVVQRHRAGLQATTRHG